MRLAPQLARSTGLSRRQKVKRPCPKRACWARGVADRLVFAFMLGAQAVTPALAQSDCLEYDDYLRVTGEVLTANACRGVAMAGTVAFSVESDLGSGSLLRVIDLTDPEAPNQVGALPTPGHAAGITLVGSLAYIADQDAGLFIVDISNPASPFPVSSTPSSWPNAVAVSSSYAYLACGSWPGPGSLEIFDVSNPASPTPAGSLPLTGNGTSVAVVGNYAYVVSPISGLQIVDVSVPTSPTPAGSFTTSGQATGVAVSGSLAYVADGDVGLTIVDVSNPFAPFQVGVWGNDPNHPEYSQGVVVLGTYAYLAADGGFTVIDVSAPANPTLVGALLQGSISHGVALAGGYACLATYYALLVVDVSNVFPPPLTAVEPTTLFANQLRYAAPYCYVYEFDNEYPPSGGRLEVVDVSTPSSPQIIGGLPTTGLAGDIDLVGSYAVLGGYDPSNGLGTFEFVDVSVPTAPAAAGSLALPEYVTGVDTQGNFAFVAAPNFGLRVVDISVPSTPSLAGSLSLPGEALDVAAAGSFAYIAAGSAGLQVVNISNPAAPTPAGSLALGDLAFGVTLNGSYAYVACFFAGLSIVDISTPSNPVFKGAVDVPGKSIDVALAGSFAYLSAAEQGMQVVDITNPTAPEFIGAADDVFRSSTSGIQVGAGYVYVADGEEGLLIFDDQCETDPTPVTLTGLSARHTEHGVVISWTVLGAAFDGFLVRRSMEGTDQYEVLNEAEPVSGLGPWEYVDTTAPSDGSCTYMVDALFGGQVVESVGPIVAEPQRVSESMMAQPRPNPASGDVTVHFELGRSQPVRMWITDVGGRLVRYLHVGTMRAGGHSIQWDRKDDSGIDVPGGVYFVRGAWSGGSAERRVIVIR